MKTNDQLVNNVALDSSHVPAIVIAIHFQCLGRMEWNTTAFWSSPSLADYIHHQWFAAITSVHKNKTIENKTHLNEHMTAVVGTFILYIEYNISLVNIGCAIDWFKDYKFMLKSIINFF